ncbi:MAG: pitrilysin family protein [Alphaproteobacteria bacterium]|jgi:zinc protease|nr:peptidase M16 [Rhodospirillaceae bacterium]MDP6405948.1 pitrilysin family protein [Alphaproteobacteria bacterium]MDP6623201.1 pitrilysin family protein [Alphaproteobacteria bacterium]
MNAFRHLPTVAPILVLAVVLMFAGPARAGLFNPTTFTLENGMQVVMIPDHRAPVVTHMVWYKVGAADEPPGKSGVAHLLEHLMFKGTAKVPGGAFSKTVARLGGRENAFTAHDYTGYFQTVAAGRLATVMELEADRMVNLVLSEADVLTERDVVMEERRSRTDNDPGALLSEHMAAGQYLAHPYRLPVIGWAHEASRLVRADVLAFYDTWYAPNNAILIVAGDITETILRPLAERIYGALPVESVPPRVRPQEPPQLAARRVVLEDARVRQPSFSRSYLAPSRTAGESRHAVALQVLADILGGGATSRLYQALVVEQKLASGAGAYYRGSTLDLARFHIYASPPPGGEVAALEAAADRVLAEVLEKGVSEAELERSKAGMIAAATYARDNVRRAARFFGTALVTGRRAADVEAWPEHIAALTIADINAAARHVLRLERSITGLLLPEPAS